MSASEREAAWLRLLLAPQLGAAGIRRLLDRFGNVVAAAGASSAQFEAAGLARAAQAAVGRPDARRLAAALAWLEHPGHRLVGWDDEDFPALLRRAPHPPAALFVAGSLECLWSAQIAVVGTRNPTAAGRDLAADFARSFAHAGFTVTSGLAEGIDAAAHQAALAAGGATIAVVGTGPDLSYPSRHAGLAERIPAQGALVSEYPPGTPARREHFPARNRIIAGLSLGVLVIEAALRSGALITARLAAEAGREVFALPGSVHNPMAKGCHRLIREGTALVETSAEVIEALGPVAAELAGHLSERLGPPAVLEAGQADVPARTAGDPRRERVRRVLGHDPADVDTLAQRSGLTVEDLSAILLAMELDGEVNAAFGRYTRCP